MRVYIHVPFCARRCSYCDFAIAVRPETPTRAFVDAIRTEWHLRREDLPWESGGPLQSVYFGGGTPSRLAPDGLAEILELLRETHPIVPDAEITLETNPDDVTPESATAWIEIGINRISLGVQSFEPKVLEWMHRTHTVEHIAPAVEIVRAAGTPNLSLDLIYGTPETISRDWGEDLERALALEPEHLSLYALTVEEHTPLAHWRSRGEVVEAPEEGSAREFLAAHSRVADAGFEHYEVSNASLPGFQAAHNAGYWNGDAFLGLGPSAHSSWQEPAPGGPRGAVTRRRAWNDREWEAYRRLVAEGDDPRAGSESLTPAQERLEDLYLGLRTTRGVSQALVPEANQVRWEREGWAVVSDGRVRLTPEGWLRLDALVAHLPHDS